MLFRHDEDDEGGGGGQEGLSCITNYTCNYIRIKII